MYTIIYICFMFNVYNDVYNTEDATKQISLESKETRV